MATDPSKYTWNEGARRFRDSSGRLVSRLKVRQSLDHYLDNLSDEVGSITQRLVDGQIGIEQWHLSMEDAVKRGHLAATMIAKGGRDQVKAADWARAGREIKRQYTYLYRFARQLEAGRPLNGGTVARARMYALAPTKTYEATARLDFIRSGYTRERRLLHSQESCKQCIQYAALGWQAIGTLPGVGEKSQCLVRCRCTFKYDKKAIRPEPKKYRRGRAA